MLEIPKGYYLDSTTELKIDSWMYRTEGSNQTQVWINSSNKPFEDCIDYRRYFRGMYENKKFFAKQYLKPAYPLKSIEDSARYHFQGLLLLKNTGCTPKPLFLIRDTIGMEYIEGKTIKSLALENKLTNELVERIVDSLEKKGKIIIEKLKQIGRRYDCSYNNILVREQYFVDGEVVFIDFDPAKNTKTINMVIETMRSLAR